jgi:phage tail-like protein
MVLTQNIKSDGAPKSVYLEYLPALYQDNEFMEHFLLVFESVLRPIENTIDHLVWYFDPLITAEVLLPWLASWLDVVLDPTWPEHKRRELVKSAAELYQWRGTKRGLAKYLKVYTGTLPDIVEYIPGMPLGNKTKLGINSQLGSSKGGNHFTVILKLNKDEKLDVNKIRAIIDVVKPAHTVYTLRIEQDH